MNSLLSTKELKSILNDDNLIILDASQTNIEAIQIKGARVFNIKHDFSTEGRFPNTFPTAKKFEEGCQQLGINKNSKIVVYDNLGIFSAPRVWWMFKTFGHDNISVLDGGLAEWVKHGGETEPVKEKQYEKGDFEANLKPNQVQYIDDIKQNILSEKCLIIDARSSDRFNSLVPESREGLRTGNIPKSINFPFQNLLEDGKFKSEKEIAKLFSSIENNQKPLIFSCGSGITACILFFAYNLISEKSATIYDGSWTEFGSLVSV